MIIRLKAIFLIPTLKQLIATLAALPFALLSMGGIVVATATIYLGEDITSRDALRQTLHRLWTLIKTHLVWRMVQVIPLLIIFFTTGTIINTGSLSLVVLAIVICTPILTYFSVRWIFYLIAFTSKAEILEAPDVQDQKTEVKLELVSIKNTWLDENEDVDDTTNIAQAIETAWSVFPANANKRIVLITDGLETQGDAIRTALRGNDFGIQIDTVPIYPNDSPEVMVQRIDAPAQVNQGAPFNLEVLIHSNHEDIAEICLYKNKFEASKKEVRLVAGENRVVFTETSMESGTLTYDATCRSTQDTRYDNNKALGIVSVSGKPKILLIDENESQTRYLMRVLEDAKIGVDVRNGLGVPNELADLQNYELIIFSDVPANRLNEKQMELIRTYVQNLGGGFMMPGSENSYGLGGYYKTPIEEVLPVRTDTEKKKETPSLAIVLVIDKSGSMGGIKIELAKEAARATVELLGPRDKIGVIAFDGSPFWITEMHDTSDKQFISNQVSSITSGGGTNLYPVLQQAYYALTETTAKLKHVIVLSDGHSQSGDWYGIANAMHSERITNVSSV